MRITIVARLKPGMLLIRSDTVPGASLASMVLDALEGGQTPYLGHCSVRVFPEARPSLGAIA